MYKNINIILASKHQKEIAIAKPFADTIQAHLLVRPEFDTDTYGTFTGEVPRALSQRDTVIAKATDACKEFGFKYGIASEGSFGPHPSFFFVAGDVELMSFVDIEHHITIVESLVSTDTNYSHLDIKNHEPYQEFLTRIKFGSHGIVIKALDEDKILAKGITDISELQSILNKSFQTHSSIRLETDMRAMMNPTRMNVINQLAIKLAARVNTTCKKCNTPGFGELSSQGKLCCKECRSETDFYRHKILSCLKCDYHEIHPREDGLLEADPQYCSFCNP